MEQLSDIQLYLILTWGQAEAKEGHWDDTLDGKITQTQLDLLIIDTKLEINDRGHTEAAFQKKYIEIFRELPIGHYIPD